MSSVALELWEYRETAEHLPAPAVAEGPSLQVLSVPSTPLITEDEIAFRIQQAVEEVQQQQLATEQIRELQRQQQLQAALNQFHDERSRYFREAESEVVHLALAIARKILHREAQLDPDLLRALVRIALERVGTESGAVLRVSPAELEHWHLTSTKLTSPDKFELRSDATLVPGECIMETTLGSASVGLEAQFKQIEQGMLDLLRLRPTESTNADAREVA